MRVVSVVQVSVDSVVVGDSISVVEDGSSVAEVVVSVDSVAV